jgi:ATP synthase protein I
MEASVQQRAVPGKILSRPPLTSFGSRAMGPCLFTDGRPKDHLAEKQEREGRGDVGESYRRAGPYLDASWQLVGSVVLWVAVGWFLDKKAHTAPWLLVAGSVVGMGIGFYLFFRALSAIGRKPQ